MSGENSDMNRLDHLVHELGLQASRHQRASDAQDLLLSDLEIIEQKLGELRRELARNRPPEPVRADSIPQGGYFRKRTGEMIYLRVSQSAIRHLKLDQEKTYGVSHNGNVAAVKPDTMVVRTTVEQFVENIGDEQTWNGTFAHGEPVAAYGGE